LFFSSQTPSDRKLQLDHGAMQFRPRINVGQAHVYSPALLVQYVNQAKLAQLVCFSNDCGVLLGLVKQALIEGIHGLTSAFDSVPRILDFKGGD
jgi:hypothetical protein